MNLTTDMLGRMIRNTHLIPAEFYPSQPSLDKFEGSTHSRLDFSLKIEEPSPQPACSCQSTCTFPLAHPHSKASSWWSSVDSLKGKHCGARIENVIFLQDLRKMKHLNCNLKFGS
jgi:hypothetical protein